MGIWKDGIQKMAERMRSPEMQQIEVPYCWDVVAVWFRVSRGFMCRDMRSHRYMVDTMQHDEWLDQRGKPTTQEEVERRVLEWIEADKRGAR